jgi:energy-coupling factor transport system permease protein
MVIVVVTAMRQPLSVTIAFGVVVSAAAGLRMFRAWVSALKLIGPVTILVMVITVVSFDYETGMVTALRLTNLLSVSFIWFHTMTPEQLGDGLRQLRVPYGIVFVLTTSMRYVPLMNRRIGRIIDAQRARGIDMRLRVRNLSHFMALLMPLLVQSFLLSEELAMAMEARGFSRQERTIRRTNRLKPWEYFLMIGVLAAVVGFLWWETG